MKNIFTNISQTLFSRRAWDPNSISGLNAWEPVAFEDNPPVAQTRNRRGVPHNSLPLAERLKKVRADLEAFEESLPDLNKL